MEYIEISKMVTEAKEHMKEARVLLLEASKHMPGECDGVYISEVEAATSSLRRMLGNLS
jgi:hypothetical protein